MSSSEHSVVHLILGAAGGIGSAVCRRLAALGATVALAGRPSDRLDVLARQLGTARWELDGGDPTQVEPVVSEVQERFVRIDGVANCIGSLLLKPAHLTSFEEWNGVISANLTSAFAVVRSAAKAMQSQGGSIVFPCNQFLGQEPGSAEEIKAFCRKNYGVTFDLFDKVEVNGENACDLYKLLTSLDTKPKGAGKIGWNFEKFLINRKGMVVARFGSGTKPDDPAVVAIIERELATKLTQP